MKKENIFNILIEEIQKSNCNDLEKIIFSDKINGGHDKIIIRPIMIKGVLNLQLEKFKDNKAYHENIKIIEDNKKIIENYLIEYLENFKQINIKKVGRDIIISKKIKTLA